MYRDLFKVIDVLHDPLPDDVAHTYGSLTSLESMINIENKRHSNKLELLHRKIHDIQDKCSHPVKTHEPDPCGNESYDRCEVCGKGL